MWCGSDCRDLVFHAIEPLDKMGKLRCGIALHVLDLTRKFGDHAALRGVHSLDAGFEKADVLGHFLRRAEHLGTLHALLRHDSPDEPRLHDVKRQLATGKIRRRHPYVLETGASALDAVTHCVMLLEDDPLYNAGRGASRRNSDPA